MGESRIGRVVVASLHQALADHLPTRLEFYESYLRPLRMRTGAVGVASFSAALSFLKHEDAAWAPVMASAGRHAADWTWDAQAAWRRAWWGRAPQVLRRRTALRLARRLVRDTSDASSARVRRRARLPALEIGRSLFCDVRQAADEPLCGFYAAALDRFLELMRVNATTSIAACRATGEGPCVIVVGPDVDDTAGSASAEADA